MAQYIFTMQRLSKVVQPNRYILKDISLSFYPGAKIGVLGINGSGKSSLLRIMAGVDKEFIGEAKPQSDIKIGYLPQEPCLDPAKDVRGNVEEGIAEIKAILDEYDAISMRFAEPMSDDEMNKLIEKQGDLQTQIETLGVWDLNYKLERAADALRLPAWDADVTQLSGGERRRVALCRLLLSIAAMGAVCPKWLRYHLTKDAALASQVLRIFIDEIEKQLKKYCDGITDDAKLGAVSFIQRFGSRLNLHIHFHCVVLDGLFYSDEKGTLQFADVYNLGKEDSDKVEARVRKRVLSLFKRRAILTEEQSENIKSWKGSGGFSVNADVAIEESNRRGAERLIS